MKDTKLLYITDLDENTHESSVDYLFGRYLKKYMKVTRIFLSKNNFDYFKNIKDDIVFSYSSRYKIGKYIDFSNFDFIIIRNRFDILASILKQVKKENLHTKIGFQLTFPHSFRRKFQAKIENRGYLRKSLEYSFRHYYEKRLLKACDYFFPISWEMKKSFFYDLSTPTLPLPMGVDCESEFISNSINKSEDNIKKFVYIGTIDPLRRMDLTFQALTPFAHQAWSLDIYTQNIEYTRSILPQTLKTNVNVHKYMQRTELMKTLSHYDCGIFLLPENPLYNVASPTKVMDYYQAGIPALMSRIPECLELFDKDCGFFSSFDIQDITKTFQTVLNTPSEKLESMGKIGQNRVRRTRSYCDLAEKLFNFLSTKQAY